MQEASKAVVRGESEAIGVALAIESLVVLCASMLIGCFWGLDSGLSALLGGGAYLFPYAIAFFVFFHRVAPWRSSAGDGVRPAVVFDQQAQKKRKRVFVGGFVLAEIVKIGLTLGILIAAAVWYRRADWPIVLISFAVAIQANWVALWFALRRAV